MKKIIHLIPLLLSFSSLSFGQVQTWRKDGNAYWQFENKQITEYTLPNFTAKIIADSSLLMPAGTKGCCGFCG